MLIHITLCSFVVSVVSIWHQSYSAIYPAKQDSVDISFHFIVSFLPLLIYLYFFPGHEVVIVKNGVRICGTGGALGNIPILQNKAYFEVKLQQSGEAKKLTGKHVVMGRQMKAEK